VSTIALQLWRAGAFYATGGGVSFNRLPAANASNCERATTLRAANEAAIQRLL
jgi:hypothetical protein